MPVNETLKAAAIFLGSLGFIKGEKGLLKGAIAGVFTVMLSYLAFSALGGSFALSWLILLELLLAVVVGGLCGGVAVNLRRE